MNSCPICRTESVVKRLISLFDDRFGCPNVVDVWNCVSCGHFYTNPNLGKDEIQSIYENYYGRSEDTVLVEHRSLRSPTWRWIIGENNLGQFYVARGRNYKVLDLGSGDCQNLFDLSRLGFECFGFDVDSKSEEIGRKYHLKVKTGNSVTKSYQGDLFDFIQLNQVIEHFINPNEIMLELSQILNRDGRIFISTPNAGSLIRKLSEKKWINWHVPYHQHHFSKRSLVHLAQASGWLIESHRTVTPMVWVLMQIRRFRKDPVLGVPNMMMTEGSRRRGGRATELLLLGLLFIPVRIIDALGFGDCQIVILKYPE